MNRNGPSARFVFGSCHDMWAALETGVEGLHARGCTRWGPLSRSSLIQLWI